MLRCSEMCSRVVRHSLSGWVCSCLIVFEWKPLMSDVVHMTFLKSVTERRMLGIKDDIVYP